MSAINKLGLFLILVGMWVGLAGIEPSLIASLIFAVCLLGGLILFIYEPKKIYTYHWSAMTQEGVLYDGWLTAPYMIDQSTLNTAKEAVCDFRRVPVEPSDLLFTSLSLISIADKGKNHE